MTQKRLGRLAQQLTGDGKDVVLEDSAIPNVGTAGTTAYPTSVTVDSKGRVTSVTAGSAHHTDESIQDLVANLVREGANITITYDDTANTLTFACPDEDIQDVVGGMVSGNTETGIMVTYDDDTGKLNFSIDAEHPETVQDIVGGMVTGNTETGIAVTYDDDAGKLNFVISLNGTTLELTSTGYRVRQHGITSNELADASVGTDQLADGGVSHAKLGHEIIETENIHDGAVTNVKLSDGSVTSGKIGSEAVTDEKIDDATITTSKFNVPDVPNNTTQDYVLRIVDSNGTQTTSWHHATDEDVEDTIGTMVTGNTETGISVTYDDSNDKLNFVVQVDDSTIEINTSNQLQIKDLGVTNAKLANGAVTSGKLADDAVTTGKINDAAVTADKIGTGAVTNAKLATNSVTPLKIASDAVTTVKINDAAVTNAKLADDAVDHENIADNAVRTAGIQDGAVTNAKIADTTIERGKFSENAEFTNTARGVVPSPGTTEEFRRYLSANHGWRPLREDVFVETVAYYNFEGIDDDPPGTGQDAGHMVFLKGTVSAPQDIVSGDNFGAVTQILCSEWSYTSLTQAIARNNANPYAGEVSIRTDLEGISVGDFISLDHVSNDPDVLTHNLHAIVTAAPTRTAGSDTSDPTGSDGENRSYFTIPVRVTHFNGSPTDNVSYRMQVYNNDPFIDGDNIIPESIPGDRLEDSAVTTAKLADNSVTQAKMTDNSVGTAEIIDANVTRPKLSQELQDKLREPFTYYWQIGANNNGGFVFFYDARGNARQESNLDPGIITSIQPNIQGSLNGYTDGFSDPDTNHLENITTNINRIQIGSLIKVTEYDLPGNNDTTLVATGREAWYRLTTFTQNLSVFGVNWVWDNGLFSMNDTRIYGITFDIHNEESNRTGRIGTNRSRWDFVNDLNGDKVLSVNDFDNLTFYRGCVRTDRDTEVFLIRKRVVNAVTGAVTQTWSGAWDGYTTIGVDVPSGLSVEKFPDNTFISINRTGGVTINEFQNNVLYTVVVVANPDDANDYVGTFTFRGSAVTTNGANVAVQVSALTSATPAFENDDEFAPARATISRVDNNAQRIVFAEYSGAFTTAMPS